MDSIVSQINVMQRMKDVYVRMMGQEKYKKIVSLMNQMPGVDRPANLSVLAMQSTQGTPNVSTLE